MTVIFLKLFITCAFIFAAALCLSTEAKDKRQRLAHRMLASVAMVSGVLSFFCLIAAIWATD